MKAEEFEQIVIGVRHDIAMAGFDEHMKSELLNLAHSSPEVNDIARTALFQIAISPFPLNAFIGVFMAGIKTGQAIAESERLKEMAH